VWSDVALGEVSISLGGKRGKAGGNRVKEGDMEKRRKKGMGMGNMCKKRF